MLKPECESTRETIQEVACWFDNLEHTPLPEDPDYEDDLSRLSTVLEEASEAFEVKPLGCQMSKQGFSFVCGACDFWIKL